MSNFSTDFTAPLPLTLIGDGMYRKVKASVSLAGAYVNDDTFNPAGRDLRVKTQIPSYGAFEFGCKVIGGHENGTAIEFTDTSSTFLSALRHYLTRNGLGNATQSPAAVLDLRDTESVDEKGLQLISDATYAFVARMEEAEKALLMKAATAEEVYASICNTHIEFEGKAREFERSGVGDNTIRRARAQFHADTDHLYSQSYLSQRARIWPRGYHGDYKTLEGIYRNYPVSSGFGGLIDRYFLATRLPVAVRGRLAVVKGMLSEAMSTRKDLKILDVACGSCRGLAELAPEINDSRAMFTCLDSDEEALGYSLSRLSLTGIAQNVEFRRYNAIRLVNHERSLREFGRQDIIYTLGLLDYLPDETNARLLRSMFELLNPGGRLIVAFPDLDRYGTEEFHYFLNWILIHRTHAEARRIIDMAALPATKIEEVREPSGVIVLYTMEK